MGRGHRSCRTQGQARGGGRPLRARPPAEARSVAAHAAGWDCAVAAIQLQATKVRTSWSIRPWQPRAASLTRHKLDRRRRRPELSGECIAGDWIAQVRCGSRPCAHVTPLPHTGGHRDLWQRQGRPADQCGAACAVRSVPSLCWRQLWRQNPPNHYLLRGTRTPSRRPRIRSSQRGCCLGAGWLRTHACVLTGVLSLESFSRNAGTLW